MFADDYPQAIAYLEADRLRHLVHLKFLHLYPDVVGGMYAKVGGETAILLDYPTQTASKDASSYPDAQQIYLPVASGEAAARCLIAQIQQSAPAHFAVKFCDPLTRDLFLNTFGLQYARTVISYTISARESLPPPDQSVRVVTELDDAHASLYARNEYPRGDLEHYFADGAQSFSIYEGAELVCSCFAFRNFGHVWEIAGLHTLDHARRKGYARQVVIAALDTLVKTNRVPRYQAESHNTASMQLAESLGLTCCLRFEHFLSPGQDFS
ncbi:MAG: GNAT family N-acetyltransferase [Chloroflexota bacterium]